MRPLINNFVGSISGEYPPQYRLNTLSGLVEVVGTIQLPSSGSYNGIDFYTLPAASPYISGQGTSWAVVPVGTGSPSTDATSGFPRCYTASPGGISINGIQSGQNGYNVRINGFYPVPGYNGFITS
jgi:hypothetical protein